MNQRRLILLRHAKSSWDRPLTDHDRPLARRGLRDAPRMAQWFSQHFDRPQRVLCSTATRCRQTVEPFIRHLGIPSRDIRYDAALYHAGAGQLEATCMDELEQFQSVMLVAHNPGLDGLLQHLVADQVNYSSSGKLMTTAAMAIISLQAEGQTTLETLMRPRELSD
ncbi:MAG: histidine phosphatase family protein [Xanthomonadales bacterium]|nr:histidine phosphatase family protein [Xanthomonadales bacterium]